MTCDLNNIPLRRAKTEHLYAVSSMSLEVKYSPRAKFSQIWQCRRGTLGNDPRLYEINFSHSRSSISAKTSSSLQLRPDTSSVQWPHLSSTILWPNLATKYTATPIFTPDRGGKVWRTNLGDSTLGWAWEGSGQVHKMMQRKDITSKGVNFGKSFTNWALCASRLGLRECNWYYKRKPTMKGAVVRLLVVFSGMVRVAWAPTPLGKETPKIKRGAEER